MLVLDLPVEGIQTSLVRGPDAPLDGLVLERVRICSFVDVLYFLDFHHMLVVHLLLLPVQDNVPVHVHGALHVQSEVETAEWVAGAGRAGAVR